MPAESHKIARRKRLAQSAAATARKRAARGDGRPTEPYNRAAERRVTRSFA